MHVCAKCQPFFSSANNFLEPNRGYIPICEKGEGEREAVSNISAIQISNSNIICL